MRRFEWFSFPFLSLPMSPLLRGRPGWIRGGEGISSVLRDQKLTAGDMKN